MSTITIDDSRVYGQLQLIMALLAIGTPERINQAKKEVDDIRKYLGYDPFMKYAVKE